MGKNYITRKGKENLIQAHIAVDSEINETMKLMGESAKMDNDLRENPDYLEKRVKAMYELPTKKSKLKERLENSIVIEDTEEYKNFDGTTVIMGSEVLIDFEGEEISYKIMGTDEGNLDVKELACNAPISKKLLGVKQGQTINFNGSTITVLQIKLF